MEHLDRWDTPVFSILSFVLFTLTIWNPPRLVPVSTCAISVGAAAKTSATSACEVGLIAIKSSLLTSLTVPRPRFSVTVSIIITFRNDLEFCGQQQKGERLEVAFLVALYQRLITNNQDRNPNT